MRLKYLIFALTMKLINCQEYNYIPKDENGTVFISYDKDGNRKDVPLEEINKMFKGRK